MKIIHHTQLLSQLIIASLLSILLPSCSLSKQSSLPLRSHQVIESISKREIKVRDVPENYLNNKEFILELISKNIFVFNDIPEKYYDDFDVMAKASNLFGALKKASDRLKDDKQLIKIYVSQNGVNLQYASDRLKHDLEIIELSLKSMPPSIKYVPVDVVNREMVVKAITTDNMRTSQTYQEIPEKFKLDKEIIKIAFAKNYNSFEHIPDSIKNDDNFILELIRINPRLLDYGFEQKNSPSFKKKVKEMMVKKEIKFDDQSPNRTISFLNFLNFSEYVKDDGKALYLKLRNGTFTKIEYIFSKDGDETAAEYPTFWGYIKDLGFYVVNVQLWEGNYVYLIDDVTGERLAQVHSYPHISPDKKYLIYAQSSDAYSFSGIEIFEINPHKVKSVYTKELYGFNFDSWKENNSFMMKSELKENEYMLVYKNKSGWDLKEVKK